jgi:hypothetical protein
MIFHPYSTMIPALVPRSQTGNRILHDALNQLGGNVQIRQIDDSPSTPGHLVFPSLGIACVIAFGDVDDAVSLADLILQRRRRCLILAPGKDIWEIQLRWY